MHNFGGGFAAILYLSFGLAPSAERSLRDKGFNKLNPYYTFTAKEEELFIFASLRFARMMTVRVIIRAKRI